ncbi:MAG TPA: hypothetical protein VHC96_16285 [Puia sp.]|jgi:hypothetical protein|nr:hypothetical protein [Puia sp.]
MKNIYLGNLIRTRTFFYLTVLLGAGQVTAQSYYRPVKGRTR